jgi:hypothetical protein
MLSKKMTYEVVSLTSSATVCGPDGVDGTASRRLPQARVAQASIHLVQPHDWTAQGSHQASPQPVCRRHLLAQLLCLATFRHSILRAAGYQYRRARNQEIAQGDLDWAKQQGGVVVSVLTTKDEFIWRSRRASEQDGQDATWGKWTDQDIRDRLVWKVTKGVFGCGDDWKPSRVVGPLRRGKCPSGIASKLADDNV